MEEEVLEEVSVEELVLIPEEQDVYWQEVELPTLTAEELGLPQIKTGRLSNDGLFKTCVPTDPLLGTTSTLNGVRDLINSPNYTTNE